MAEELFVNEPVRRRLAIALDLGDLAEAAALARVVRPYFGVAKIGLELYSAAGPRALAALADEGFDILCDLKLHDIPNTVGRAARQLGRLSPSCLLTVHTAGGAEMLRVAVEGFAEGAGAGAGGILGVTVLTSDAEAPAETLQERAALARDAGCAGVVCAADDLPVVVPVVSGLVRAVPGIRPTGTDAGDQKRTATPAAAVAAGASLLVVGRAVTGAADVAKAAAGVAAEAAAAFREALDGNTHDNIKDALRW
ncbi:MAG: orotidine-5'-phosphate decarboxylase [Acidimicrobiales bacterium]